MSENIPFQGYFCPERKDAKTCHVGIHWKALAEYSQMSSHLSFFSDILYRFLHHFVLAKLATSSIRVISCLKCICICL